MIRAVESHVVEQPRVRMWAVREFCRRHRVDEDEEHRLGQLFGQFASASELLYNASRSPRWRD
nr:hypothetical protein [Rhizobium cauense]